MGTTGYGTKVSQRVNIVVTCTKRKRVSPTVDLRLRDVHAPDPRTGFSLWLERLSNSTAEHVPARHLYAGDHWSIVETLEGAAAASGFKAGIWVCSAGYGLVGLDSRIKSYSATFSADQPDTVCKWAAVAPNPDARKFWWRLHAGWSGPDSSMPRSIAQVAIKYPEAPMLVVASQAYLRAIVEAVREAAEKLCDPDLLCVISAGTNSLPTLEANLLPANAALQKELGGGLHSLNIRLARAILSESAAENLRASFLSATFRRKLVEAPPISVYQREAMTDEEVKEYIKVAIGNDSNVTKTALLRRLRDNGLACNQGRFSRLFQGMKSNCC